jgi:ferritin
MKKPVKLNTKIVTLLEERLNDEFVAAFFYRDASNYLQNIGYFDSAKYFAAKSVDEFAHAKGIEDFLVNWNIQPKLPQIDASTGEFDSLIDVIEKGYNLEFQLYESYEETSMKIFNMGDLCVFDFLAKYRNIQTKSVSEYSDFLNLCDSVNTDSKFEMLLLEEKLFGEEG